MDLNPALSARSTPSARKLIKQSGSLEIIKGDTNTVTACQSSSTGCFSSDASSRPWSRSSVGSVPPRPESASGRGVSTPTKQISLQAVRRKDDSIFPYNDKDFKVSKYDLLIKNTLDTMEHADKLQHWEDDQTSLGQKSHHATKLRLPVENLLKEKAFKDEEYKFDFISSINVKKSW
ncbi:glutamate-rich protein 2 [Biomphalaria pfeifferi]|uniref:Glutamate-rich protein 2 n=1 Tax=Biomphalaria pfeifferi TaxID=112525 RepID=A0AAD8AW21_BIOPF|nr:glutamate-rich protein 2 [Biomphalaria pfeifferi]